MRRLSRRRFLQLSGLFLTGGILRFLNPRFLNLRPAPTLLDSAPQTARTLRPLPVYEAPSTGAPSVTVLWPDSMVDVLDKRGDWCKIAEGFVERDGLRPMKPFSPAKSIDMPDCPFQAEVAAPTAPVRAWCAADAPLVIRMEHESIARIIDALPHDSESGVWYAVAGDDGDILGWSQAIYWRSV